MRGLTREQFKKGAALGASVPVFRELPADLETPVSVYLKLCGEGPSFLLESVEKAEQVGRYSFLGFNPRRQIITRGKQVTVKDNGSVTGYALKDNQDPLEVVEREIAQYQPVAPIHELAESLPRFFGGAVGYMSYDLVHFFERLPDHLPDELNLPELHMLITDSLVVFDHVQHRLLLFVNVLIEPDCDLDAKYDDAVVRLDALETRVRRPLPYFTVPSLSSNPKMTSNHTQAQYEDAVRKAKNYIMDGDIFQVVLSQRLSRKTSADPFSIYRALRRVNPSPYMFFLDLDGDPALRIIGSSPEVLVRLQDNKAEVRPIAGTRPRGANREEDQKMKAELLADPKERAEHVMLVDLGRNDLGRVCEYNTVTVPELLVTETYSHVIHIVSQVQGKLRQDLDAFDLLRATFPAGTLSGAPKIRAMEIIDELEVVRRGPYGGAVGYFGFNGNMDTCITIRTMVMQGDRVYLQAGAGIVADSDPATEYKETLHKAGALSAAIRMAERGEL
ncbi:MAG: anthranilate synthase component I [Anaerolineae bacterium]|nr:anthranilate synthase component I [Anaerolineae bacterium]